jgi:hypothetical protein
MLIIPDGPAAWSEAPTIAAGSAEGSKASAIASGGSGEASEAVAIPAGGTAEGSEAGAIAAGRSAEGSEPVAIGVPAAGSEVTIDGFGDIMIIPGLGAVIG